MKRRSRVAVCCGRSPTVIITVAGDALAHVFVVESAEEVKEDSRFWEVSYEDVTCNLGLPKAEVGEEWRRLACLLWLAVRLFTSSP